MTEKSCMSPLVTAAGISSLWLLFLCCLKPPTEPVSSDCSSESKESALPDCVVCGHTESKGWLEETVGRITEICHAIDQTHWLPSPILKKVTTWHDVEQIYSSVILPTKVLNLHVLSGQSELRLHYIYIPVSIYTYLKFKYHKPFLLSQIFTRAWY